MKIQITKTETRYIITKEGTHNENKYNISVVVKNGRISIYRYVHFNEPFEFIGSKPETIKAIAELLLEASKL